jgi:hypothetical protein
LKREAICELLPEVFRRTAHSGTPLFEFLGVLEQFHAPAEAILSQPSETFNPRSTDDRMLPFLSRWVNLDWLFEPMVENWKGRPKESVPFPPGIASMRELIALGFRLNRESGTVAGILLFLRTATGMPGFSLVETPPDADGVPIPFHVRIHAPAAAQSLSAMVTRIIEFEKPAYLTYELIFDGLSLESHGR